MCLTSTPVPYSLGDLHTFVFASYTPISECCAIYYSQWSIFHSVKYLTVIFTPRTHARARGYVIGRGLYICIYLQKNLNLSKYLLSEVHSNTGRLLIEFNRLQYTLAAPEVFVAFANPVCLPSWYRVSIVRNTNIDRSKPHPYGIVEIYTVEHAYSTICCS